MSPLIARFLFYESFHQSLKQLVAKGMASLSVLSCRSGCRVAVMGRDGSGKMRISEERVGGVSLDLSRV